MSNFTYKDPYIEDGRKVIEMNVLPEKHCNFDCIFCPIGRSKTKVDEQKSFEGLQTSLDELGLLIDETQPDLVFINSKGEALVHENLGSVIDFIKDKSPKIRLLSNGYLLGKKEFMKLANMCDEVIGEIKVVTEEDFQKVQRPIEGYSLNEYISSMQHFKSQYAGKFILEVTIIKGYNDDDKSVERLKEIIAQIAPSELMIVRIDDEPFRKKLCISDERFAQVVKELEKIF